MIRTSIEFLRGYLPLVTAIHEAMLKHPPFVTKRKARCLLKGGSCNDSEETAGCYDAGRQRFGTEPWDMQRSQQGTSNLEDRRAREFFDVIEQ
jgi:hypothetical protein